MRAQADLRRLLRRGRARLLNITVTRHSDGHWYATLCFEREIRTPAAQRTAPAGPVVGVDRGVRTAAVVVVEDLATKNMLGNRHLAAAISDQGWGELARQLTYKTARHGGLLIVADRWFAGRIQVGDRHPGGPSVGICRHARGGSNEPAAMLAGASVEAGARRPRNRMA